MANKPKWDVAIKELRRTLGRTQSEFATWIGASKDTVVSWENRRSLAVSKDFVHRIYMVTGAMVFADGSVRNAGGMPYSQADYSYWKQVFSERSPG